MILCSRKDCATTACDCGARIARRALEQSGEIDGLRRTLASWRGVLARASRLETDRSSGRSKGGKARAAALTATRRSEIARAAAHARWNGTAS